MNFKKGEEVNISVKSLKEGDRKDWVNRNMGKTFIVTQTGVNNAQINGEYHFSHDVLTNKFDLENVNNRPKFNMEKILEANKCVHCKTEEQANNLLEFAESLGYKWNNGDSFSSDNEYYEHKEDTVYFIADGQYDNIKRYDKIDVFNYKDVLLELEEVEEPKEPLTEVSLKHTSCEIDINIDGHYELEDLVVYIKDKVITLTKLNTELVISFDEHEREDVDKILDLFGVKIIKNSINIYIEKSNLTAWYSNSINEEFVVEMYDELHYKIKSECKFILKSDCKIIE